MQCVIKNLTVLSQNLDDPYYLCISMCSCRCANVCTCSDSCTMEAVLGKIKSGRGDFPIHCLVFYDPKMLQNRRNQTLFQSLAKTNLPQLCPFKIGMNKNDLIFPWDVSPVCVCSCTSAFPSSFACDCALHRADVCIHLHVLVQCAYLISD